MKKMIVILTCALLVTSGSALQAKDQELTTQTRLLEAAKGTAFITIAAANSFFFYHIGMVLLKDAVQGATKVEGKTFTEAVQHVGANCAIASAIGALIWATAKSGQLSYEAFKKATMNPTDKKEVKGEIVQSRTKTETSSRKVSQ